AFSAHAAGVDDDEVGPFGVVRFFVPLAVERLRDPLGIVDVHLTTEGLDRIARHRGSSCARGENDSVIRSRWPPPLSFRWSTCSIKACKSSVRASFSEPNRA